MHKISSVTGGTQPMNPNLFQKGKTAFRASLDQERAKVFAQQMKDGALGGVFSLSYLDDLAGRYDPYGMSQSSYGSFLEDLVLTGQLSQEEADKLGYDTPLFPLDWGGGEEGYGYGKGPESLFQTLANMNGDLIAWARGVLGAKEALPENLPYPLPKELSILERLTPLLEEMATLRKTRL